MKNKLQTIGLSPENSVVIGSGILQALKIRKSKDIDVVASNEIYNSLKKSGKFTVSENHGREILKNDIFEIGTDWNVLGKPYRFEDFVKDSVIIDGVRYITLDFLYKAKRSWVNGGYARPKDIQDVQLMKEYLKSYKD